MWCTSQKIIRETCPKWQKLSVGYAILKVLDKQKERNKMELEIGFICTICDAEYSPEFEYGYCDETLECAMSDGESLKAV